MAAIEKFLNDLLSAPGISGFEEPVSNMIETTWRPLSDEVSHTPLGSLHALRRNASGEKRPCLMIAAHMDAIGLMVRKIDHGFLHISQIGGVDPRILPGQLVTVHGKKEIQGVVQMLPDRLMHTRKTGEPADYQSLFVDTGLAPRELERLVTIGDIISFSQQPITFGGGYLAGHSLDNRASVAALTVCLQELRNVNLQWDVWAAATVQEEMHLIGGYTSTFHIQPDLGIAVDVTFAKGPGANDHQAFPLGKGITIGVGANNHPALQKHFMNLAQDLDIPYSLETMPRSSGTDGMAMQITAGGVPTIVLGIPIRYMHTPVELTSLQDIKRAGRLLARFISGLESDSKTLLFEDGRL